MSSSKVLQAFQKQGSISTDSRKVKAGDVFFALVGDNFDGNLFAQKAVQDGAAYAVVSSENVIPEGDDRYILVPDVLLALQELAREYRRTFSIPFLGITGTNGKTTTKELIHAVMSTTFRVHATVGNLNNHIGVPLTLLSMDQHAEFAIIEMGANKPGDIKELAEIAEPTHGLITNIGRAHLERLGSLEGVQRTKGELFDFIANKEGTVIVNIRDERVFQVASKVSRQVTYGREGADYWIEHIGHSQEHLSLTIHFKKTGVSHRFKSNLIGPHNAENVLAAVVVGDLFGVSVDSIQKGLEGYLPKLNRTELIQGNGFRLLLDAYNANPSSMEATLRGIHGHDYGRMALILGDMFELGESSPTFHSALVELVKQLFPNHILIGIGKEMTEAVHKSGFGKCYLNVESAALEILKDIEGIDFILLKGSRGMALERLLPTIGVERNKDH